MALRAVETGHHPEIVTEVAAPTRRDARPRGAFVLSLEDALGWELPSVVQPTRTPNGIPSLEPIVPTKKQTSLKKAPIDPEAGASSSLFAFEPRIKQNPLKVIEDGIAVDLEPYDLTPDQSDPSSQNAFFAELVDDIARQTRDPEMLGGSALLKIISDIHLCSNGFAPAEDSALTTPNYAVRSGKGGTKQTVKRRTHNDGWHSDTDIQDRAEVPTYFEYTVYGNNGKPKKRANKGGHGELDLFQRDTIRKRDDRRLLPIELLDGIEAELRTAQPLQTSEVMTPAPIGRQKRRFLKAMYERQARANTELHHIDGEEHGNYFPRFGEGSVERIRQILEANSDATEETSQDFIPTSAEIYPYPDAAAEPSDIF